jgi:chromosome segregation ATPase
MLERRLADLGTRLRRLREDLAVADEQLAHFAQEADEARLRMLVSETPLAEREHRDAQKHADVVQRHRESLSAEIAKLETTQDDLLDQLIEAGGAG